jgi:hypothetical protein
VRGGGIYPKEGTATMHKTTVQSEPKAGNVKKRLINLEDRESTEGGRTRLDK